MRTRSINGHIVGWTEKGGDGPTTVLLHAGGFGAWFDPLAAVLDGRVISMRRTGYAGGPAVDRTIAIADHADQAAALLDQLEAAPATVVAHSSGCVVALQLALDHPQLVSRLVLSEPPLIDALLDPAEAAEVGAAIGPVIGAAVAAAAQGEVAAALDTFLAAVCGGDWETVIAGVLGPSWRGQAERDAAFFFANEIPALMAWSPGDLSAIKSPSLLVQGGASPGPTHRLIARLAAVLPAVNVATISGANHLLPLTHPAELAALITT